MAESTMKLQLPLLQGSDLVSKDKINAIAEAVDETCLPVSHVESKQHWTMWEASTVYGLKDVVKTSTCPTWGFLECTQPGASGDTEPTGLVGEGDTKTEGATAWILRRLGSGIVKHGDLTDREKPRQHPIGAITDLQAELDKKAKVIDVYTKIEIDQQSATQRSIILSGDDTEIQYPWEGTAQLIQVNCKEAPNIDFSFAIEKQSKTDYEVKSNNWQKISGQLLTLPAGSVYKEYVVSDAVAPGDLFRANLGNSSMDDITIQVRIQNINN